MTERLMSFVRGFSADDYYSAVGAFRGSLPAGFMVSAMFRNRRPNGVSAVAGTVCSQFLADGQDGAGWMFNYFSNSTVALRLQFLYAAAAGGLETAFVDLLDTPVNQRTLLVSWFFGVPRNAGANPDIHCYVNGVRVTLDGASAAPIANGYLPAPGNNVFQIGRSDQAVGPVPGEFLQVAGFSYFEGMPTGTNPELDEAIADIAAAQWDGCSSFEDMIAGPTFGTDEITNSFSVRRGCPNAGASWEPELGDVTLTRQAAGGNPNLSTLADKPKYWSGQLQTVVGPI